MRVTTSLCSILAVLALSACGGAPSAGTAAANDGEEDPTLTTDGAEGAEADEPPATAGDEAAADATPAEAPVDHQHANIRLLDSVANGETPFSELLDVDARGLLVVENHDGDDGRLVQNALHLCHRPLSNRYEHLTESLRADLARGRELNDMACNASLEGPPRMDCSMGGTEEAPTTHYIFEETEDGLRLESIFRISEVGKSDRYITGAFRFAERQAGQVRRHGCR